MATVYRFTNSFDRSLFEGASCVFGVFDGMHKGHQALVEQAQASAQVTGGSVVALTFDIDPDEIFRSDTLTKIADNDSRIDMLANSGVDAVVILPFTRDFASLEPIAFLDMVFDGRVPHHIHVGEDFRFGRRASGTVDTLRTWGAPQGMRVHSHQLLEAGGLPITATRIRELLGAGKLEEAEQLLGRPYSLVARVQHGRKQGREFGFCTANLDVAPNARVLASGVYAGWAHVGADVWKAAISMGPAPSFADENPAPCEVHLLDFDECIYDQDIRVEFVRYLRPMKKFEDIDELIATVMADIEWVRGNLRR